ncbi:hypothetical protein [uncultured Stenotrophomonas sp.]|nr:hypothetical protein [uncultured Stenotrophomonas sp.]
MAIDTETRRGKLDRMMTSLAKEQAKLLLAERAEQSSEGCNVKRREPD